MKAEDLFNEQIGFIDFSELDDFVSESLPNHYNSFQDFIVNLIFGDNNSFSFNNILTGFLDLLTKELFAHSDLAKNIIIIGVLSGIIKCLSQIRKDSPIGQVSFFSIYSALIMLLFVSFKISADVVLDMINILQQIMTVSLPVLFSVIVMSGNIATATTVNPLMYFVINVIINLMKELLIPFIVLFGSISILNYLTEEDKIKGISDNVIKLTSWFLKIVSGLFISIMSMQRIVSPIASGLITKTAKTVVGTVPIIGQTMQVAVDNVLYLTGSVKSSVAVGIIILTIILLSVPLVKIATTIFMYKIMSSIIKPICNDRIHSCIENISSFTSLLLGSMVCVAIIFLYFIIMVISL